MADILRELLVPVVGISISPLPIVGIILILMSKKPNSNSIFYLVGWVAGNILIFMLSSILVSSAADASGQSTAMRIIRIVLGLVLIVFAIREFRKRPKKGQEAKVPKWFEKLDDVQGIGALGIGFFMSAINPKNLLLGISAGSSIGALKLPDGEFIFSIILYVILTSIVLTVPTVMFRISKDKITGVLHSAKSWLINNNAVIMSVIFLMIGVSMISKAL